MDYTDYTRLFKSIRNRIGNEIDDAENAYDQLLEENERLRDDYERAEVRIGLLEKELEDAHKPRFCKCTQLT